MSNTPNPINAPALIWSISLLELWKCTTAIMMMAVKHNTISQHRMQSQKIFLLRNDLSLAEFLLFGGWSRPWLGGPSCRPVRVECSLFISFLKFQPVVSNVYNTNETRERLFSSSMKLRDHKGRNSVSKLFRNWQNNVAQLVLYWPPKTTSQNIILVGTVSYHVRWRVR